MQVNNNNPFALMEIWRTGEVIPQTIRGELARELKPLDERAQKMAHSMRNWTTVSGLDELTGFVREIAENPASLSTVIDKMRQLQKQKLYPISYRAKEFALVFSLYLPGVHQRLIALQRVITRPLPLNDGTTDEQAAQIFINRLESLDCPLPEIESERRKTIVDLTHIAQKHAASA
jgi:hypothetical protein